MEHSATAAKEVLIDPENSNSSITETAQDIQGDAQVDYATDNDLSDKKLSECSNLSCSSDDFQESMKLKMAELTLSDFGDDDGAAVYEKSVEYAGAVGGNNSSSQTLKNNDNRVVERNTEEWVEGTNVLSKYQLRVTSSHCSILYRAFYLK